MQKSDGHPLPAGAGLHFAWVQGKFRCTLDLTGSRSWLHMTICKEMVECEIIEQHENQSDGLRDKRANRCQVADAELDQEGQHAPANRDGMEAQAPCQPRTFMTGQATERKVVVGNKVCQNREFGGTHFRDHVM